MKATLPSPLSRMAVLAVRAYGFFRDNAEDVVRFREPLGRIVRPSGPGAYSTTSAHYGFLERMFDAAHVDASDSLLDVGCGRGRVVGWLAGRYPRCRVVGVELNPDVAVSAAAMLARFSNVQIVAGSIMDHFPDSSTVVFMFNPFDRATMDAFAKLVLETSTVRTRLRIVYLNCAHLAAFERDPRWRVERQDIAINRVIHTRWALITVAPGR